MQANSTGPVLSHISMETCILVLNNFVLAKETIFFIVNTYSDILNCLASHEGQSDYNKANYYL